MTDHARQRHVLAKWIAEQRERNHTAEMNGESRFYENRTLDTVERLAEQALAEAHGKLIKAEAALASLTEERNEAIRGRDEEIARCQSTYKRQAEQVKTLTEEREQAREEAARYQFAFGGESYKHPEAAARVVLENELTILRTSLSALTEERKGLRAEIAKCLSPENENVKRGYWTGALRDVQQILITSKDNAREAIAQLEALEKDRDSCLCTSEARMEFADLKAAQERLRVVVNTLIPKLQRASQRYCSNEELAVLKAFAALP